MGEVYNPVKLINNYMKTEHGKTRIDAIRYAIEQADLNNDILHMVYFRIELCEEADWYGNGLDIVTVFPELLAIIDNYTKKNGYDGELKNIFENVLWTYEDMISISIEFYQIPFDDCTKFLNDFKNRWISSGRGPREPYRMMAIFYVYAGHMDEAYKAISVLKTAPMMEYDCPGCCANSQLLYYLANNEKDKADQIAIKINNGTFKCGNNTTNSNAVYRMNKNYLKYYIMHGDYEQAAEKASFLEHITSEAIDYKLWASFMCAYVYTNTGRGLRIYKKHWKDIENEQRPEYMYYSFKDTACFFMGLEKVKNEDSIKLRLNNTFPLYNEDNIYNITDLAGYYYKKAEDVAKKFDKRNGNSTYMKELEMSVENILTYNPEKEGREI